MKTILKTLSIIIIVIAGLTLISSSCYSQISSGKQAELFSLKDSEGKTYDLSAMKKHPLLILYFFDVESRPSQEGLLSLDQLVKQYKGTSLNVWAITLSPKNRVSAFIKETGLNFPVLLDSSNVSKRYNAQTVLPTVCVVGPGLRIMDYFQGGGKSTETMLVRVAERELQQKHTEFARAVSSDIIKKNPQNVKARTVEGYAALKENNLDEAEKVFSSITEKGTEGEVLGKEGLAAVYAKKDQKDKALKLVEELEQKAPDRSYPHVIKGDILYAQNKKKEAEQEYQKAVNKKTAETYQEAVKYNQMGRMYASTGDYKNARALYDQAVTIDPYYIEGTTNKGLTYEKEGQWDKALESYRQALAINEKDNFAAVLVKKAQEMLDIQKDAERKKRMDQLIKDLSERYKVQKKKTDKSGDTWTSGPMVLSFVDIQEKGGLAERDGFSMVLMTQLADLLNASGRVKVVERAVIDLLLEELNLGSSELADPETALRLGKVLAARLIGTGSVFYMPQGTLLNLRLIDTETSAIPQVTSRQIDSLSSLDNELFRLNREILRTVIEKYPLQGYVVKDAGEEFIINIGAKQGVVTGTKFDVVEEQEPIKYKGKLLKAEPRSVASLEVVRVEPDLCYVRVLRKDRPLRADDKVQEKIEQAAL
ncbi:MAG: tetratricopeptide repeat protein [Nitrospiraceae bacterium]|nr:MAG: tetratricopeptide repeat protein [Nitrospiraceae bacterium]